MLSKAWKELAHFLLGLLLGILVYLVFVLLGLALWNFVNP